MYESSLQFMFVVAPTRFCLGVRNTDVIASTARNILRADIAGFDWFSSSNQFHQKQFHFALYCVTKKPTNILRWQLLIFIAFVLFCFVSIQQSIIFRNSCLFESVFSTVIGFWKVGGWESEQSHLIRYIHEIQPIKMVQMWKVLIVERKKRKKHTRFSQIREKCHFYSWKSHLRVNMYGMLAPSREKAISKTIFIIYFAYLFQRVLVSFFRPFLLFAWI